MPQEPKKAQGRGHRGPVTRAGTAYVRTRTAAACQICRSRRVKCDNERPCSYCRRIGATCSPGPTSSTGGFDPASLAILAKLEELQGDLRSLSGHVQTQGFSLPATTPGLVVQDPPVEDPPALRLHQHLQRGNIAQVLAWDIWQPYEPPQCLAAGEQEQRLDTGLLNRGHDTALAQNLDVGRFTGYLDAFFHNVHILNPVLDEQQIRSQWSGLQLNGIGWDATSCLLLLVLANGASSSEFAEISTPGSTVVAPGKQRWAHAQALFDAAEKRKDMVWRSDYLTQARCHFYTGMFMMVSMRPFDAWRHFLLGLATCQRSVAPAHRRMPRDSAEVDKQAEESIYWSCWKSERELRFELDMPGFNSPEHEYPLMFPKLPEVLDQGQLRAWYFYLAEISLWRSEMTARQTLSDFARQHPSALDALAERITELEKSLASWQASLPDTISLEADIQSNRPDVLLYVLRGRLTYNYELLTWPFLETQLLLGAHTDAGASVLAAWGVRAHCDRLSINRPGFYYQHHGTWLMQRSSARSACVLLAVAQSSSSALLPAGWEALVSDTIAMLEYWAETPEDEIIAFMKRILLNSM